MFLRVKIELFEKINLASFSFIKLFPFPSISIASVPILIVFKPVIYILSSNCILVGSVAFCIILCNSVPEETVTSLATTKLLLPLKINNKRVEYNSFFFFISAIS